MGQTSEIVTENKASGDQKSWQLNTVGDREAKTLREHCNQGEVCCDEASRTSTFRCFYVTELCNQI